MPRAPNPESSALLPVPQHMPQFWRVVFVNEIEKDDPVWKEYLEAAQIFDSKMLAEWNSFLDVILVFIGLFIAVLASFIIDTQKLYSRDPTEVTNELLVHILNQLLNSSSVPQIPFDITQVKPPKQSDVHTAMILNTLLFVSLALAIVISMMAMASKLWLIRYISLVREPGSSYDRAMKRQEAFNGFKSWKFHRVINTLPLLVLLAVFLLGAFIYLYIRNHIQRLTLAFWVGKILGLGLTFILAASASAAFIPSSPFHSPFSRCIECLFILIPKSIGQWRAILIFCFSVAMAVATVLLVAYFGPAWQILILFPAAGTFAMARTPIPLEDYSPWYRIPVLVLTGGITVVLTMDIAAFFYKSRAVYVGTSVGGFVALGVLAVMINRLTRFVPDTLPAEAVAWLLESSPQQQPELFEKAGRVASTTPRKMILLDTLNHLLPPLIDSHRRPQTGRLERSNELRIYLACLAQVSDFQDSKSGLWRRLRNRAVIKHPALPHGLRDQLEDMRGGDDIVLSDAAASVLRHYPVVEDEEQISKGEEEA